MKILDYIVIGSGCSAAMSAQTLIEANKQVFMIDVGVIPESKYVKSIPNDDFITARKTDTKQYRYLIGDHAEGLSWGSIGKGAQLTPPRSYMTKYIDVYHSTVSSSFSPVESFGYGGLGIGWGLQCWEYSDADLDAAGLDKLRMREAYKTVSGRIGVSAKKDDTFKYSLGNLDNYQPSADMDRNHSRIYKNYLKHKIWINKKKFFIGRTPLALLTKDKNNRSKYMYKDMDFYSDSDGSAWRPWLTINELKKQANFTYQGGCLVVKFVEKDKYIEVHTIGIPGNDKKIFYCKKLILATGSLSTGRIVLRSKASEGDRLPFLCNPYTYIPCLQPSMFGKEAEKHKIGFAQLSLFFDESNDDKNISIASTYSYQSLMLFRIILQTPFNFLAARSIMRYLMSGLVIMGVHHPDKPNSQKYMQLIKNDESPTGDELKIEYFIDADDKRINVAREKKFIRIMRKMNIFAISRINPGYGSSIHYAGTLPFSNVEKNLTLSNKGKLHMTKNVYVADSSGFNYLPARGLTFSLLANAHLVAENVINNE